MRGLQVGLMIVGAVGATTYAIAQSTPPQAPPSTSSAESSPAQSSSTPADPQTQEEAPPTVLEQMKKEADGLRAWVKTPAAIDFIAGVDALPSIPTRTLHRHLETKRYISGFEFGQIVEEAEKAKYEPYEADEARYYLTRYGSPLAYSRAMEIIGEHGLSSWTGTRIVDFGYGTVGHLRMLASRGAEAVGVDVDTFLAALYSEPRDQGLVPTSSGVDGRIKLVHGRWPLEEQTAQQVAEGGKFDVFISKNTLKNGYIHPPAEHKVDERRLIKLGVDDETYVKAVYESLKPGGLMLIYNLCPAQADLASGAEYIPWADGHCPFPKALLEKVGFEVIAFDHDDSVNVHQMGRLLGWDEGQSAMDFEKDLFAWYTLARKKSE